MEDPVTVIMKEDPVQYPLSGLQNLLLDYIIQNIANCSLELNLSIGDILQFV